ncbi:MAG: hypothetical protein H0W24_01650, partial [Lysobacter sp.]|nr:hypothetical protein [Lysobacter sp.]
RTPVRASAPPAVAATPAWHDPAAATSGLRDGAGAGDGTRLPAHEGLERARAYLEIGDHVSARLLLAEIVASGDPAHSQQAARMLHELG